jgi:hypothetical protein
MKTLFNLLILLGVAFTSLVPAYSQKKVESSELKVPFIRWWNCLVQWMPKEDCIEKMSLTIENNTDSVVRKVTFWVEIRNTNDQIIYKRKHSININLDPGEIGDTEEFNLYNQVWGFDRKRIYVTIISVN